MPGQRLPMRKIRDVLRLSAGGMSKRKIAISLSVGATAAGDCIRRARRAGLAWPLPTDTWHEVIGEPTFADAILDRIVHNAYRLALDGPSMRKIQAAELEAAVPVVDTTSSTSATTAKGAKK